MPRTGQHQLVRPLPALRRLPRAVYARAESLPAASWLPPHRHEWAELAYAVSGVLEVRTPTGSFLAPRQRAVWIPPGVEHEARTAARTEMRSLYLDREAVRWAPARCRVLEISALVRELIRAVASLPVEYGVEGPEGRIVSVLLDRLRIAPEVRFSVPLPADPRLAAICASLRTTPDDRRTLGEWARAAGASERTLGRLFLRETGVSFREWRLRLRLLAALTALEEGTSVTAVALDSGYDSPSAFIAAFKRVFGGTPTQLFRPDGS